MSDTNKAPGEFNPVKRNESLPVIKWEDFDRIGKEKIGVSRNRGQRKVTHSQTFMIYPLFLTSSTPRGFV